MPSIRLPRTLHAYCVALSGETGISLRTVIRWAADETDSSPATAYACLAATRQLYGLSRRELFDLCPWELPAS